MTAIAPEHLAVCFACTLRNLPPLEAAALLLREVHGFSTAETAKVLDATPVQVKNLDPAGAPHDGSTLRPHLRAGDPGGRLAPVRRARRVLQRANAIRSPAPDATWRRASPFSAKPGRRRSDRGTGACWSLSTTSSSPAERRLSEARRARRTATARRSPTRTSASTVSERTVRTTQ
ncbi:MAG: hypothetical protein HY655_09155 [Acidobacteria bacterium]|nr:hypothetical protein [Acidobacteriota bacterium]